MRKIFFPFSFDLRWMNYIFYTYIEEFLVRRELERVGVRNRCISIGRRAVTKRFYTRRGFIDPFSRLTIARLKAKRITSHDRSYYRSTTTNDYALLFQDLLSLARNNAYIYMRNSLVRAHFQIRTVSLSRAAHLSLLLLLLLLLFSLSHLSFSLSFVSFLFFFFSLLKSTTKTKTKTKTTKWSRRTMRGPRVRAQCNRITDLDHLW